MSDVKSIFKEYFSTDNLLLAWERMIRSNKSDTKDVFGIKMYAANLEENLQLLSKKLINNQFKASRPFKYYEPKASKTHRTKTVLGIEDAIVYQAIANRIAEKNYQRLFENNSFVFGSVLHPEVEKGVEILKDPDAEYYFFEYYIPLYNKFINSVNKELDNEEISYQLNTDITGFFDSIPHSKLLITLSKYGIEDAILELLEDCLNMYSGTKESITPGVGLPQGPAPSFLLANVFLTELDHLVSQHGYTYYRYMDDIRIYEETEEKLMEVLVIIDNHLKGKALSLNSKKTSIEEITEENREFFKARLLKDDLSSNQEEERMDLKEDGISLITQNEGGNEEQNERFIIRNISGKELIDFCQKEIKETENYLLKKFKDLNKEGFKSSQLTKDEELKSNIIHLAYRWRAANSILKKEDKAILHEELIPIWLFCAEHFFWKANHFCWNLNQYGANKEIQTALMQLLDKFQFYEWVRYQILSNLSVVQEFTNAELREMFRAAKIEKSSLVRLGYYLILIKHVDRNLHLYAALKKAIKEDKENYIKQQVFHIFTREEGNSEELKYWFGL